MTRTPTKVILHDGDLAECARHLNRSRSHLRRVILGERKSVSLAKDIERFFGSPIESLVPPTRLPRTRKPPVPRRSTTRTESRVERHR